MTTVRTRDEYAGAVPGRDAYTGSMPDHDACAGSMPSHEVPGRNVSTADMSTAGHVSTSAAVPPAVSASPVSASAAMGRGSVGGKR
jgi:hypothetical protein